MSYHHAGAPDIVPREQLDFGLDGDIPKYWLAGDVFKTRMFDALSTLFPVGERFFITCVRDFKDQITDPELQAQIRDFTRQEAQHSMLHTRYNDRLAAQGVKVSHILKSQERRLFGLIRQRTSRRFSLGITAAAEHVTSVMANAFVERHDILEGADERIRALYVWHAMEEMEHKAVAYDVLKGVAKASYFTRILSMLSVSLLFPYHVVRIMNHMFRVDGYTRWGRVKLWSKGLWWLFKPGGLVLPLIPRMLSYYQPGFHPWQHEVVPSYPRWLELMSHLSPVEASNQLMNDQPRQPSPSAA
jgi:predicted metal-dependent hydrolase